MSDMVTIYGFAPSTFVRTVRMVCVEKGISHELLPLEFKQATHEVLHPFKRMPIIKVNNTTLFESLACATYLDEAFLGQSLQPVEPVERAIMHQWISACSHYLYHEAILPLIQDSDVLETRQEDFQEKFLPLDIALQQAPFVAGSALTLADLFVTPIVAFLDQAKGGEAFIDQFDALRGWSDRIYATDSFTLTAS